MTQSAFVTRADLLADLRRLGVTPGDVIMVHAAMSKVGRLLNGPDALIGALLDAVGPTGTILAYTDWDARYEELLDAQGRVPEAWKPHIPPFDPLVSRAIRDNGVLPEFLRTTPGALRSGSPGPSVAALGAQAKVFTENHPIDYGYGPGSPLARLAAHPQGKVLIVGAPRDTVTLLHHAEHLANLSNKRLKIYEVPLAQPDGGVLWRRVEEFETGEPVVAGLAEDYFAEVVTSYLETGAGAVGRIGEAESLLVDASAIVAFAVDWLEARFGPASQPPPSAL